MTALSLNEFQALFSPNIRAWLNWPLLETEEASIETSVVTTYEELSRLFTVWHVFPDGSFADWNAHDAQPQTVEEAVRSMDAWDEERKLRVRAFQEQYQKNPEPVNLLLPVYKVEKGFVLLDSTHRVMSVVQAGLPFTALLVAIAGPIDDRVLPDLRWHQNSSQSE